MRARNRIVFVITLIVTSGLLTAGVILFATSGVDDLRGRGLCFAATGIGMSYVVVRLVQRRRTDR
ncbi:hypothetical protein B5P19_04465 [Clavibacter sepedonicus]|uniref:Membrane protein n=1 Tax=Clavibacter sepedonicus TaxID=31964 RepID=B0RE06_CLASE|nr:hypothetical protein B5P19_04465 [Clavibacter sepedonicus]OQJ53168.1 hypothetical protein B5P20_02725 [Clavibacter sepedonicus]CAQ01966.1 putative membrane protein [Clavibacter sepedonicus]